MTVRVNKPAFNLREKLSELERPIGLKGSELMKSETVQDARDLVSAGRKNLVINGDMKVAQRGTSFTSDTYTLDRWRVNRGGISSLTTTQSSSGLDSHPNALKVECTANASQAAGTDTWIRYAVEDVDSNSILNYPNSNKSLTLSFWVRANVAGQYSASITSGNFGDRFIHAFRVNANTWEYKSFTIPPPSLWGTSSGYGLRVYFDLGSGSNYQNSTLDQWIYSGSTYAASGNTRVTGVNGRTFEITGVQLEVGKNATEFEHRSYGEELALCQRYYQNMNSTFSYSGSNYGETAYTGWQYDATNGSIRIRLPVQMRTNPTLAVVGTVSNSPGTNGTIGAYGNAGWMNITSVTAIESTPLSFRINVNGLSGSGKDAFGLYFYGSYLTSNVKIDAEL